MAELMVVGFEGKHRATEVLKEVEAMSAAVEIDLKDAVAVYRTDDGKLRIDKSVEPTTKEGATRGVILGALLGAIVIAPFTFGASTAIAASAIGAGAASVGLTGGVIGADEARRWKEAAGVSDAFVRQVGGMIQPGHSAVFVLAHAADPAVVAEHFRGYGGKVLRTTLPPDAAAKFRDMMSPVAAAM